MDKFEEYRKLMFEQYLPIKVIAKKTGVSVQTAFDWRHKILGGLNAKAEQFQGITEIDDIWFLYSQKGRKGLKYSRKRGGSKRQGDNNYQVKLLVTADRESNQDFSVARIGRIKKSDLERKVGGKFNESCILVSDKHRSISAFAKSEKISHVSFKSSEHSAGGEFHVQTVNNLATRMKGIVNHPFYTYTEGVDVWTNPEDGTKYESNFVPVWRWRRAQFNNFRCRMDWCTELYENANHHPKAVLNGDHSNKIFFINAKAGDRITLDASGSNDPDGDQIEISWWNYREAGTYEGMPKIGNPSGVTTAVEIPRDAAGKEIHLILEVKDLNKIASLWDYRRMVITVQNQN